MVSVGEHNRGTVGRLRSILRSRIPAGDLFSEVVFRDNFDRANAYPLTGANWSVQYSGGASGTNRWQITGNLAYSYNSTDVSSLWLINQAFTGNWQMTFTQKSIYHGGGGASGANVRFGTSEAVGATTTPPSSGVGLVIGTATDGVQGTVYFNAANKGNLGAVAGDTWYNYRVQKLGVVYSIKRWLQSSAEPTAWSLAFTGSAMSGNNTLFVGGNSAGAVYSNYVDNVVLYN